MNANDSKFRRLCAEIKFLYPTLWKVAQAIKTFEGWCPEKGCDRSWRNNNPGNLRSSSLAESKDEDNYAIFLSYEQGMYALLLDLIRKCSGHSSTSITPESTLLELMAVYAPAEDGNEPHHYAVFLADQVKGIEIDTPIWRLLEDS